MSRFKTAFIILTGVLMLSPALCATDIAISVNGDNIYRDEFDYLLSKNIDSYKKYFGNNIDEATSIKLRKDLADDLVEKQIYLEEGRRRGISAKAYAAEDEIDDLVMQDPIFYTDGRFDDDKYEKFTLEGSAESKKLRDRAEEIILSDKLRSIIVPKVIQSIKDEVTTGDLDVTDEYLNRAEKMRVAYIKINPSQLANKMDVRDEDIKDYYKKNEESFRKQAVKRYAVLYFDPADYTGMVSISPDMLKDYYAQHLQDYLSKRSVKAKYVLFRAKDYLDQVIEPGVNVDKYYEDNLDKYFDPAEAHVYFISIKKPADPQKLVSVANEIKEGVPFSEIAKKYSDDPTASGGGDLGLIKQGVLKEPFNGVAFNLPVNSISEKIETDTGYYYVAVKEKKDARLKPFEEVKDEIETALLSDDVKPLALADAKRFRVDAKRVGFDEAVKRKNKTVFETEYFNIDDIVPSIGRDSQFVSIAVNMNTEEASTAIEYSDGYAVLKLTDAKPQYYLSFDDVAKDIERKLMREDSSIYAENAAKHALDLFDEKVPVSEITKRTAVRKSVLELPSTMEAPPDLGKVISSGSGYSLTLFLEERPSYISAFQDVSAEAASGYAMQQADELAQKEIESLRMSGALTTESAVHSAPFAKSDFVIGTEYMKPFIEQCFNMEVGETGVVKSMGSYYLVRVLSKGIDTSGHENETALIKSQVLKEKRQDHLGDWLKNEREKSEIKINI